jgi:hypothetical protein
MSTTKSDSSMVTVATFALAFFAFGIWMVLDPAGFQATSAASLQVLNFSF